MPHHCKFPGRFSKTLLLLLYCTLQPHFSSLKAQDTYEQIYNIMQASCTGGCHAGGSPAAQLDLSQPPDDVYDRLVNVMPLNPFAASEGYGLVKPGDPDGSFLFRKVNNQLYHTVEMEAAEGNPMPDGGAPALGEAEIELLRLWIMYGAPRNGEVADAGLIDEYYTLGGLPRIARPPAPAPGEGYQLYFGTVFLPPGGEKETHKMQAIGNDDTIEVYRIEVFAHDYSHHTVLQKYHAEAVADAAPEIIEINGIFDAYEFYFSTDFVLNSQLSHSDIVLPPGTAFVWEENAYVDLNYHIKNYSSASILPAEFYVNLYTQPKGTAERKMMSETVYYGGTNPFALNIDNNGQDTLFSFAHYQETNAETRDYWMMQGHTHSRGVDYDIFVRNPDGSEGEQIYEGFYNADHTFDQGYFDYEHPPVRTLDPMLAVDMANGLVMEATFNNSGPAPVGFGLTTEDEMFAGYLLYTMAESTDVAAPPPPTRNDLRFGLRPNPITGDSFRASFELGQAATVSLQLFDLAGKQVCSFAKDRNFGAGKHTETLSFGGKLPQKGMYLLQLTANGQKTTKKVACYW